MAHYQCIDWVHTSQSGKYDHRMHKIPSQSRSLRAVSAKLDSLVGPNAPYKSVRALATALGQLPRSVQRYVSLESDMSLGMLDDIADALGVEPAALISTEADARIPHPLVLEGMNLLRRLPAEDLQRALGILRVFSGAPAPHTPKGDLDKLTLPTELAEDHSPDSIGQRIETRTHPRKRKARDS